MRQPVLSIGIPVYNGERYVRQCIESLLKQTYENFELIICDNASTDATGEICRSYLARDKRVRYYRSPINIGQLPNFQRAFELSSADYFMWAACDDFWAANYLSTLMDCLFAYPDAALAAGKTLFIDEKGTCLDKEPDDAPPRFPRSSTAAASQLLIQHAAGWLHGIYRRSALRSQLPTLVTTHPWGGDVVFLLKMCVAHTVIGSNSAVFFKRLAMTNTSHGSVPRTPRRIVAWQCWYTAALIRVILSSAISLKEKIGLLLTCSRYLRRLYLWEGPGVWTKTWLRAGCHWLLGLDRS